MFTITPESYKVFNSFKFRNLKHFNTHDGVAYSCELYHNSVKIADVWNDGNGGMTDIEYTEGGEKYLESLKLSDYHSKDLGFEIDNEYIISDLIEVAIMIKKSIAKQSKSIVFIKDDSVHSLVYKHTLADIVKAVGTNPIKKSIEKVMKEGGIIINTNLEKLGI